MHRFAKAATAAFLPWLAALAVAGAPAIAAARDRSCLAPSGDDDTAALQAALDRCAGASGPCTVTLCAGTFRTGILRVKDFRGTLRGAGAHATTLKAQPDLEVSANPQDFFRDEPFGSLPWPYLLQFVEGRAAIRDLGILVPAPPAGSRPTTGWTIFASEPIYELRGALLLTGRDPVDFEVSRVRVMAERDPASELETTAFHGVEFGGLLFDPDAPGPFPVFPARGSFELTDSEIRGVLNGTPVGEIAQANVRVAHNRFRSTVAVDLIDADRSQVAIVSNRWDVSYRGVQVSQNLDGNPSRASGILVDDNRGLARPRSPPARRRHLLPGPLRRRPRSRRLRPVGDAQPPDAQDRRRPGRQRHHRQGLGPAEARGQPALRPGGHGARRGRHERLPRPRQLVRRPRHQGRPRSAPRLGHERLPRDRREARPRAGRRRQQPRDPPVGAGLVRCRAGVTLAQARIARLTERVRLPILRRSCTGCRPAPRLESGPLESARVATSAVWVACTR